MERPRPSRTRRNGNTTLTLTLTKNDSANYLSVDIETAWLSVAPSSDNTTVTFEDVTVGASLSNYGQAEDFARKLLVEDERDEPQAPSTWTREGIDVVDPLQKL